jgi:hypothetical protein
MATETKYNLNVPSIPDDEPIILFRAQDKFLPQLLHYYKMLSEAHDSAPTFVLDITKKRSDVIEWQTENKDKVKVPD